MRKANYLGLALLTATLVTSTASSAFEELDNLEGLNRSIFSFNRFADATYIKPVTVAYETVIPYPARASVQNFIFNVYDVPTIVNDILTGKACQAFSDTFRLAINTTLGIFGLFDVATPMGFPRHKEDLGKTMYVWGWKESNYFVIPILGPSTIRDTIGLVGNLIVSPQTYFKPKWRNRYYALDLLNHRSNASEFETVADVAGVNYYNMIRSSHLQNRYYVLTDGKTAMQGTNNDTLTGQPPA